MSPPDPRTIAHDSLARTAAPYLRHYRGGRFTTWNGIALTGSSLPGPGFNFAAVLGPAPPLAEVVAVARTFFADCPHGWGVLVEADAGHPIEAEVRAAGWAVAEDEPAYVMPEIPPPVPPPAPLTVHLVEAAAGEAAWHAVTVEAFLPPPELYAAMMPAVPYVGDPDIALLTGAVAGRAVSVAGFSRSGPTAVVWGVATVPAFRGRGYGAAVTRAALAEAAARGCVSAALRSGPLSRPLYERLGFRYVCSHRTYAAPRG